MTRRRDRIYCEHCARPIAPDDSARLFVHEHSCMEHCDGPLLGRYAEPELPATREERSIAAQFVERFTKRKVNA